MSKGTANKFVAALSEHSSYVENTLRHAFMAEMLSIAWSRDPSNLLHVFNSEVDDSGFDVVLQFASQTRYVQLKQAYDRKGSGHCSVRLSFAKRKGSCIVLMSHSAAKLRLTTFRFFGSSPDLPMPSIDHLHISMNPGRRDTTGKRKTRKHYRNVKYSQFSGPLTSSELFDALFPSSR